MSDDKKTRADGEPDRAPSRYQRVKQILDAASAGSCADYQGYGQFWNRPLGEFLKLKIYGVRMIAPPSIDDEDLTPREVADLPQPGSGGQGASPRQVAETPKPSSCCGSDTEPEPESPAGCCGSPAPHRDPGRGARSGLIKGLKGEYPFDGSQFPPLLWDGQRVSASDARSIEEWIDDGCPESDERPSVEVCESSSKRRAMGDEEHPVHDGPTNQHRLELDSPRVRKNIQCMTPEEFRLFQVAIAEMRRWDDFPADERSWFFWAQIHANNCQHGWEQFLPWHRAYLYEFELKLQDWDPLIALPYWDWADYYPQNYQLTLKGHPGLDRGVIPGRYGCWIDAAALAALKGQISDDDWGKLQSIEWNPKKPEDKVYLSGTRLLDAAGIPYPKDLAPVNPRYDDIERIYDQLLITNPLWHRPRWPGGDVALLFENYPSPEDLDRVLEIDNFYKFGSGPAGNHYFGAVENIHNLIHNFSGGLNPNWKAPMNPNSLTEPQYGDMQSGARTAYDPIFWGHHSNMDRLWFDWQQKHPGVQGDDPAAVLPPWTYTVEQMQSIYPLGYEYMQASHHFPTDPGSGMVRFKSAKAGVSRRSLKSHRRAEVRLHNVRYREKSGAVKAFINAPDDTDAATSVRDNDHFVGQFNVLHGQCVGGPGHCDPPAPRRPNDRRPRHRKTPRNVTFDATDAVRKMLNNANGEPLDFHIHLVAVDLDGKPSDEVLQLESVSLNFFD